VTIAHYWVFLNHWKIKGARTMKRGQLRDKHIISILREQEAGVKAVCEGGVP
jgi:hypothetical protein